jgi:hypothetical protein
MVDITVSRNLESESEAQSQFAELQSDIFATFGQHSPAAPAVRCRNATQTSVVLEWDPLQLATAELRSLSLYRNGGKAGNIPRPLEMQSTKISGLAVDTEYVFHLVLQTSAGTYSSEKLAIKTHKMTDLSGITITPGVLPPQLRESLGNAVQRIGAKLIDSVRIDTTHFVCLEGRGLAWEKAVEMNIPVVRPEWVEGCEKEGRIVGVRGYYLNAKPGDRQFGQPTPQQTQARPGITSRMSSTPKPTEAASPTASPAPQEQTNGFEEKEKSLPIPPAEHESGSSEEGEEEEEEEGEGEAEPKIAEGPEGKAKKEDMKAAKPVAESLSTKDETAVEGEGTSTPSSAGGGEGFSDVAL